MDLFQTPVWRPGSQSGLNRHRRRIRLEWTFPGEFGCGVEVWCIGLKRSRHDHWKRLVHYGCEGRRVDLHHHGFGRGAVLWSGMIGYHGDLIGKMRGGGRRGHSTAKAEGRCQIFGSQPWQYNHLPGSSQLTSRKGNEKSGLLTASRVVGPGLCYPVQTARCES